MFKLLEDIELRQISLTGTRALLMVGLLMKAPRSLEDLRKAFIDLKIMEPEHSDDILRIDLNTLRTMGCEISRSSAKTGFKYVLQKHPFSLNITEEDVLLLKKIYKKIKDNSGISLLLKYDELFKKLAFHVANDEIREKLYGISVLKYFDVEKLNVLKNDCDNNSILTLILIIFISFLLSSFSFFPPPFYIFVTYILIIIHLLFSLFPFSFFPLFLFLD